MRLKRGSCCARVISTVHVKGLDGQRPVWWCQARVVRVTMIEQWTDWKMTPETIQAHGEFDANSTHDWPARYRVPLRGIVTSSPLSTPTLSHDWKFFSYCLSLSIDSPRSDAPFQGQVCQRLLLLPQPESQMQWR